VSKVIRVAIVGTGNIARLHAEAYQRFPERCKIVALADIMYPQKAELFMKRHNIKDARLYNSHTLMLADSDIDLVSVCTPPYSHAEIAVDCLNAGRHVLLEKPMAASLEECDDIISAAKKNGRILSSVAQNRFNDSVMNLKKTLDNRLIGRVVHAQVDSFWWRGHSYYDLWWRGLWEKEGGGCTLNHAVHHIDMLCWMLGMPMAVTAVLSNAAHDNSEVEDISVAILQYGGGALAQVTSSVIHHGEEQQIIFQGERARVSAPWKVVASLSMQNGFPERNPALEKEIDDFFSALPSMPYTGHDGQIEDMLTAIETGKEPFISGEQGRATIELISAIYKSGAEHLTVKLPIQKNDPFYTVQGILKSAPRFYKKSVSVAELGGEITVGSDYKCLKEN
jgi:predicted dehydrogenase